MAGRVTSNRAAIAPAAISSVGEEAEDLPTAWLREGLEGLVDHGDDVSAC